MAFLDDVKDELIAEGIPPQLFDYMEDRINQIISDKLSQCIGDLEERMTEEMKAYIRKRT